MEVRCKVACFGYSVEFTTQARSSTDRRAEANQLIIAKFGAVPKLSYVELGVPFPAYVPVEVYDEETRSFY